MGACSTEQPESETVIERDATVDASGSSSSSSSSGTSIFDAAIDVSEDAAVAVEEVHFVGRFDTRESEPRFQWSGSALLTKFRGTGIAVRLRGEAQLEVVLDGEVQPRLYVNGSDERYALASGLSAGEHTLELHKRDEAMFGPVRFGGFEVEAGELVATPSPRAHRIEFIGDSITCGYGNEDTTPNCRFSANTENHYLTYAALTARALDAVHTAIAWSGRGMFRNYPDASRSQPTMPQLYDRILPNDESSLWDFSRYTPEAVVINLGTNDYAINDDPGQSYTDTYVTFLQRLRGIYPEAHLFAIMQRYPAGAQQRVQDAVNARNAAGDAKVHYFGFGPVNAGDGVGCDGHPSVAGHQRMASELTPFLRSTLGW